MKHIFSFSKNKEKKELSSAKRLFIGSSLIILSLFLFISFVSYFFTGEIDQSNLAEFTDISISNSNSLGKIGAPWFHTVRNHKSARERCLDTYKRYLATLLNKPSFREILS